MEASPFAAPVRSFMSRALVSVSPTTTAAAVATLLEERGISAVPVLEADGSLRGIVSLTDLLRAQLDSTQVLLAAHVLRKPAITIDAGASLRDAARAMVENRIHRLVVVEGAKPIGILSTRDAMRAIVEARVLAPVRDVTTTPTLSIEVGESIDAALAALDQANVRGVVVVDSDWPVGVFSQTEALRARALPSSIRQQPVEEVMSYETICMDAATPLYRVASQARAVQVRRILVTEHKKLYGIASGFDLVRYIAELR